MDALRWQELLRRQDGVASRVQAGEHGWTKDAVHHRVRSGQWQLLLRGVLLTNSGTPTRRQLLRAALVYAGPGAALAAATACLMHGLERVSEGARVFVAVPRGICVATSSWVVTMPTARPYEPAAVDGLPVTACARSVVDACLRMTRIHDVRALVAEVVQRGRASVPELQRDYVAGPRQGSLFLRLALEEVAAGASSVPEAVFLRALRSSQLCPPYELNVDVHDACGRWLARPDVVFRAQRVIVEIDGVAWHLSPHRWAADLERHTRLEAAGWTVLRYPASRVMANPGGVCAEVLAVVTERAA